MHKVGIPEETLQRITERRGRRYVFDSVTARPPR